MNLQSKNKKGFTLVELLIVISLLAIFAVALLPRFISQPEKAKMAEAGNTLGLLSRALQTASFAQGSSSYWLDVTLPTNRAIIGLSQSPDVAGGSWTYSSTSAGSGFVVATRTNSNSPPTTPTPSCIGSQIILNVSAGTYSGTGCYATNQRYDASRILKP